MATRGLPQWPWQGMEADALPAAERLLLEAARLWWAEAAAGRAPVPALRLLLAGAESDAALAPLDGLMRLPPPGSGGFGCRLCPRLHDSEAVFLLGCGLAQQGERGEALAIFLGWLPLARACQAVPLAEALGGAFRKSGYLLKESLRSPPGR